MENSGLLLVSIPKPGQLTDILLLVRILELLQAHYTFSPTQDPSKTFTPWYLASSLVFTCCSLELFPLSCMFLVISKLKVGTIYFPFYMMFFQCQSGCGVNIVKLIQEATTLRWLQCHGGLCKQTKPYTCKCLKVKKWKPKDDQSQIAYQALCCSQSNNFLSLLLYLLYISLPPVSCPWSAPNYFQFGIVSFEQIFAQTFEIFNLPQFTFQQYKSGFA